MMAAKRGTRKALLCARVAGRLCKADTAHHYQLTKFLNDWTQHFDYRRSEFIPTFFRVDHVRVGINSDLQNPNA